MLHVSVADLASQAKHLSSMAQSLLDHTTASVSGTVSEIQGKIVDPLVHAAEQPVANLASAVGLSATWLRLATVVGGGWLLYTAADHLYHGGTMAKRQMESLIDDRLAKRQSYLKRRRL